MRKQPLTDSHQNKQLKPKKTDIGDCFTLNIGLFGRWRTWKPESAYPFVGYVPPIGTPKEEIPSKRGRIYLDCPNTQREISVNYRTSLKANQTPVIDLDFGFTTSNNPTFHDQRIEIAEVRINYGIRPYFICSKCDRAVSNLYLKPHKNAFQCRICQKLRYESQQIAPGKLRSFRFMQRRMVKLLNIEKNLKRRRYDNKPTKRVLKLNLDYARFKQFENGYFQLNTAMLTASSNWENQR